MGTDKAFLEFDGQTLLVRALAAVGTVCSSVAIVGNDSRYQQYASLVTDVFPGCGPLGGIHAALTSSSVDLNLMLAVDMPFVTGELMEFLFEAADKSGAVITVPRVGKGFQPLCAIYRREFGASAEAALRAGKYKIDAVFADLPTRIVGESELAVNGFSDGRFFNVNTPQDCLKAEGFGK